MSVCNVMQVWFLIFAGLHTNDQTDSYTQQRVGPGSKKNPLNIGADAIKQQIQDFLFTFFSYVLCK